jgi:hypothetical protein
VNTGGIRFDLLKGNFTLNDQKTVSPFQNAFMVLKDIVYGDAKIVLDWLNTGRFGYVVQGDGCSCEETSHRRPLSREHYDQHAFSVEATTPGYVTFDGTLLQKFVINIDFGSDGDDTIHTPIPFYSTPFYVQSNLVPPEIRDDGLVDLVFTNFSSPGVSSPQDISDCR